MPVDSPARSSTAGLVCLLGQSFRLDLQLLAVLVRETIPQSQKPNQRSVKAPLGSALIRPAYVGFYVALAEKCDLQPGLCRYSSPVMPTVFLRKPLF